MICIKVHSLFAFFLHTRHNRGVPHSSQLHRDEWDIRAHARTALSSPHQNLVISTEGKAEVEKPAVKYD
jgi:hypothetical protein